MGFVPSPTSLALVNCYAMACSLLDVPSEEYSSLALSQFSLHNELHIHLLTISLHPLSLKKTYICTTTCKNKKCQAYSLTNDALPFLFSCGAQLQPTPSSLSSAFSPLSFSYLFDYGRTTKMYFNHSHFSRHPLPPIAYSFGLYVGVNGV